MAAALLRRRLHALRLRWASHSETHQSLQPILERDDVGPAQRCHFGASSARQHGLLRVDLAQVGDDARVRQSVRPSTRLWPWASRARMPLAANSRRCRMRGARLHRITRLRLLFMNRAKDLVYLSRLSHWHCFRCLALCVLCACLPASVCPWSSSVFFLRSV